jgi:cobalt-zinc-cadmium efflux system outer membrane protein
MIQIARDKEMESSGNLDTTETIVKDVSDSLRRTPGMLRRLIPLLALCLGCQASRFNVPCAVEGNVSALELSGAIATENTCPSGASAPVNLERADLPNLWGLALAHNPALREAAADLEAARGRQVQAGLYPNPRAVYNQDTFGARVSPQGNITVVVNQEIVTAGKRRLDMAVAAREADSAGVGLVGRKFEILTRIRRAWYDYLALRYMFQVNGETVSTLERGIGVTRQQVEKARTRPQTDLLRLEALLAEARINQTRVQIALEGAWRQLAAEVGVPQLTMPVREEPSSEALPHWDDNSVLDRVLATNTGLRQAAVEVERAGLAVRRARAGAIPNVIVGGGYTADNVDETAGGVINVEVALPVWNRQQGAIHEAQARLAFAQAAVRTTENRLTRETADAIARYKAARRQVEQTGGEVLPRLQSSLTLLLKAYQAGSAQVTFSDILVTEQSLNTTRLTLAEARRSLWQAIADLEGLMQLDVGEKFGCGAPGTSGPP